MAKKIRTNRKNNPAPELVAQLEAALCLPGGLTPQDRRLKLAAAGAMLEDIAPSGGVEGMLAVQMVATHEAALECLRRAMAEDSTPELAERNMRHAERLLALYARQTDVLGRHRARVDKRAEQAKKAADEKPRIRKMQHVFLEPGHQVGDGPVRNTKEEALAAYEAAKNGAADDGSAQPNDPDSAER